MASVESTRKISYCECKNTPDDEGFEHFYHYAGFDPPVLFIIDWLIGHDEEQCYCKRCGRIISYDFIGDECWRTVGVLETNTLTELEKAAIQSGGF